VEKPQELRDRMHCGSTPAVTSSRARGSSLRIPVPRRADNHNSKYRVRSCQAKGSSGRVSFPAVCGPNLFAPFHAEGSVHSGRRGVHKTASATATAILPKPAWATPSSSSPPRHSRCTGSRNDRKTNLVYAVLEVRPTHGGVETSGNSDHLPAPQR